MAQKKGYLKQKIVSNGNTTYDELLPHTSADIVALSTSLTIGSTTATTVQAALAALEAVAEAGGQAATDLATHVANTSNPHSVTKSQVGLGSVDNVQQIQAPSSNGTADHILVFDGNTKKAKDGGKTVAEIVNIAEGKTATHVISIAASTSNVPFDTQNNDLTLNTPYSLYINSSTNVDISTLHVGDIILVKEENRPDRWVSEIQHGSSGVSAVVFTKLETRTIDLTPYVEKSNQSVPSTVPTLSWGAESTLATIQTSSGNVSVKVKLPSNPNSDTGATSITVSGSGNAVTTASYDASTRKITLTKGTTFLTSHQDISGKADKVSMSAGTYSAVTVNSQGIVTAGAQWFKVAAHGTNPTDLASGGLMFELDS